MALATSSDYTTLTGRTLDGPGLAQVEALLEVASARLLSAAGGQAILEGTSTVTLRPDLGAVRLPQRPVTAVTSVAQAGTTLAPGRYRFTPGGNGAHAYLIPVDAAGVDTVWSSDPVTITYTHGWPANALPATIEAAVVAIVERLRGSFANEDGRELMAASIDGYSEQYYQGGPDAGDVPGWVRSALDELLGVRGPTSTPVIADQ